MKRRAIVALLCFSWAGPELAWAEATPASETAKSAAATKLRLANADRAAKDGKWDVALGLYSDADRTAPNAAALLGVANASYQLGRLVDAYEAYDNAQKTYERTLSKGEQKLVAERLAELSQKTGYVSIRVNESGASVMLDDTDLGIAPVAALVRVPVGTHSVHVKKEGFTPFVGPAEVTGNGRSIVDVTLVRIATTGHVSVREKNGQSVRVILDGVDVGATPWETELPPGHHDVSLRNSTLISTVQPFDIVKGGKAEVELEATSAMAHLLIKTSDGKGLIFVDSQVKAEGVFAGDVAPGVHTISVTREGFGRFDKTVTLQNKEAYNETVTLEQPKGLSPVSVRAERPLEGTYGGFNVVGSYGVGGLHTELEVNCQALGAATCNTPAARGGGLYGYVGYTWNPIGFEAFFGGEADVTEQSAYFSGAGVATNPNATPRRSEHFTVMRTGGTAALRVRATFQSHGLRATIAGGPGLSIREMILWRSVSLLDSTGFATVPYTKSTSYVSPAFVVDGAIHFRIAETTAISVGALFMAENAGNGAATSSDPNYKAVPVTADAAKAFPAGQPIPSPAYHLATSTQFFLGPYVGLAFGP